MNLSIDELDSRYQEILRSCEPFLISYPGNHSAFDLAPFGYEIPEQHLYDPTRLHSRTVIDGLHQLDKASFGDQDMLMPRWVMFDCGEFPGLVFGFGRKARDLSPGLRKAYLVEDSKHDDLYVPLSMWVAIRCAEDGAWFGHNLSSANLISDKPLAGLGTITKAFGVKLGNIRKQYGATQWDSSSINIHLSLGPMKVLGAYTPAHTHDETLAYLIDVDEEQLVSPLRPGWKRPKEGGDRYIDADDREGILKLHDDIEKGAKLTLFRVERREGKAQRLWMRDDG